MLKKLLANEGLLLGVSFVLFLASLPVISLGSIGAAGFFHYLGLLILVVAAALPPAYRFLGSESAGEDSAS